VRPPAQVTSSQPHVKLVHTMGTIVVLDVRAPTRPPALEAAVGEVTRLLRHVDELFSTWRPDSWVSRLLTGRVTPAACPAKVHDVIALAEALAEVTDGFFSPYWRPAETGAGGPDPTGLLKGWAAQQASDILLAHDLPDHIVNAAGDIVLSGTPTAVPAGTLRPADSAASDHSTWRVGISDPLDSMALAGVVELPGVRGRWAVATSGVAELGYHVVDPHTGSSPRAVVSATAVVRLDGLGAGPDNQAGATADACATALVASGEHADALLGQLTSKGVVALFIDADAVVHDPHQLLICAQADV